MNVAIIIGQLNHKAGPSVNALRLARGLLNRECDVQIVHRTPRGNAERELEAEFDGRLLPLPIVHRCDPRYAIGFTRHIKRVRPDIVHFNLQTDLLLLAPTARLHRIPTVYTMRNLLEYNAAWLQRSLRAVSPRFISQFVAVSQTIADNVTMHHLSRTDPIVIHNGVESPSPSAYSERGLQIRRELGISQEDVVIGTCGRLSADKAQMHLLRAVAMLRQRDFHMIIVGDGQMRTTLQELCAQEHLLHVHFVGWQSEVNDFLAAMDIFVFHSMPQSEGLPTVVTEAAMMGLALVLPDIKCLREVYTDEKHALFAMPAQSEKFAAQLARILDAPSMREKLGREARAVATEHFSIDTMADRYLALYEEVIA